MLTDERVARATAMGPRDAWGLGTLLLATLATLASAIARPTELLTGHDIAQLYNWEINTRHALSSGQLPLWNPFIFTATIFDRSQRVLDPRRHPPIWF